MENEISRIDLYLQLNVDKTYVNTPEEGELVNKFQTLYTLAKSARDKSEECSPENLNMWREAYKGTLAALTKEGTISKKKGRQLRKLCYEMIESKIDNSIPMPKMLPRYKTDIPVVEKTENFLKFEMSGVFSKYLNDKSERCTYVDGTSWYKVWWDSLANSHERSGDIKVDIRRADQIVPQPGVTDYRLLEYIFEEEEVSLTRIWDLYHRHILREAGDTNIVKVVTCYYLNNDRIVGRFIWSPTSLQVICNEEDWQIRKVRKCKRCETIVPQALECPVCGGKHFKYDNADEEILAKPLYEIYNPYDAHETDNEDERDKYAKRIFAEAGTKIPFYRVRQLPFVPRPAISSMESIYGTSEVKIILEEQDVINKVLTKAVDKTLKSGAVVTKPDQVKLSDVNETFKILGVKTPEQAQMVQTKQVVADTSQDIVIASLLYESARSSSGVTDSFQGKKDTTATSGKAKEYAALQSAGRIESLRVMKSAAFSGVYELILKYLLAFSDEPRSYVRILPDGQEVEETWNKYLFLAKDKYGKFYYRDDIKFDSDPASTLSQNRVQMWQETQDKFVMGAFGAVNDPRTLRMFWNIMASLQYPLANVVLAGIKENEQHLPADIEQAIMQDPNIMDTVKQMLVGNDGRGGARPNSGPKASGATHAAEVEKTNETNRANNRDTSAFSAQASGQAGGV